jgi:hypothetical protein
VDDDPAEEDVDFEVELEAVDFVSFALAVVSLGFNALASDSILAATAPVIQVCVGVIFGLIQFLVQRGYMPCPQILVSGKKSQKHGQRDGHISQEFTLVLRGTTPQTSGKI